MTPERWREIERLYYAALERDADERAVFLNEACGGDEGLRREVESLLDLSRQRTTSWRWPAGDGRARASAVRRTRGSLQFRAGWLDVSSAPTKYRP